MPAPLAAAALAFFEQHQWPVTEIEPGEVYETSFEGDHGTWPCHLLVYEADRRVVFVSTYTALVPPERRQATAEFCNRTNFGLAIGNFELDHDGGEVRFRTSLDAGEAETDATALVGNIVVANVVTFDHYLPELEQVVED